MNLPNPNKLFFSSDLHLGHKNIITHANRPFNNCAEMDDTLVENWNNTVPEDGLVFYLGDWCLNCNDHVVGCINKLHGNIVNLWGNHDQSFRKTLRNQNKIDKSKFLLNRYGQIGDDYLEVKISEDGEKEPQKIVMMHYSLLTWNHKQHNSFHIFGHSHSNLKEGHHENIDNGLMFDVGVDNVARYLQLTSKKLIDYPTTYRPISYIELKEIMNWKQNQIEKLGQNPHKDHHQPKEINEIN